GQGHGAQDRHGRALRRRSAGAVVHADPRRVHRRGSLVPRGSVPLPRQTPPVGPAAGRGRGGRRRAARDRGPRASGYEDGPGPLLLLCFMTTLVAYLANQFFSIDVPPLAVMGWVALAGIAVLADPGGVAAREAIAAARSSQGPKGVRKKKKVPGAKSAAPYGGTRVLRHGHTRWPVHILAGVVALV